MIRPFREEDRATLKEITAEVFGPSAVDYYMEQLFGAINNHDWKWRKVRHIDDDIAKNPDGIFVYEEPSLSGAPMIVGYATIVLDREGGIGRIPNLAVRASSQGRGIGRKLVQHALDYIKSEGMVVAKIETLVGNAAGEHLYPSMGFEEVVRQIHYVKKLES